MAVGIIVTGHGRFAEGLTTSVNLIAGPQENYVPVNFEHEVDELEKDLNAALQSLKDCSGVIVFADLAGGSPYKTAAVVAQSYQNVEIIAGTNLPMLIEVNMGRQFVEELGMLTEMAMNTGKDQVVRYEFKPVQQEEPTDGI